MRIFIYLLASVSKASVTAVVSGGTSFRLFSYSKINSSGCLVVYLAVCVCLCLTPLCHLGFAKSFSQVVIGLRMFSMHV